MICRAISKLSKLENFGLDLGYTGMTDSSSLDLAAALKNLNSIQKVCLELYNNEISDYGSVRLCGSLAKCEFLS